MNILRVLLADDHALVRAGIRSLLQNIPGVEVVAEADDGKQAIEQARTHQPDIVLLDIAMPGLSGLEVAEQLRTETPAVKIVILSMHTSQEYIRRAMRAGASGYLLKGSRQAELELALQAVARGEVYLSPAASKQVVQDWMKQDGEPGSSRSELTPRQLQVLRLIAQGRSRKQIAQELGISPKTVDTFRGQLMEQLRVNDVPSLVRYAISAGLVPGTVPE